MSEGRRRKVYGPEFKAKVGLEALKGVKTINEIGQAYGVHPVQVGLWKKAIQEQAKSLFARDIGVRSRFVTSRVFLSDFFWVFIRSCG